MDLQPQARRKERCSVMANLSQVMNTEELCTFFHESHHMRNPEACLKVAQLYRECSQIEENLQSSLLWCLLARGFYSGSGGYDSFKKRSANLMRANMKELSDEELKPVKNSLTIFGNLNFRLESIPGYPIVPADPAEARADAENTTEEPIASAKVKNPRRKHEKHREVRLDNHAGSDVCLSIECWRAYLKAGRSFGWQPQGTSAPYDYEGDWNGSYSSPESQTVEDEDARELSRALDRLIDAVRSGEKVNEEQLEAIKEIECVDKELSGAQEVADYALEGGFEIYKPLPLPA